MPRLRSLLPAVLILAAACGLLATSVSDIRERPRDYDGKTVTLSGTVKESTNLLVVKYFVLDDGTGEISVVTDRPLPKEGERVRVRGVVHEAFSVGSKTLLVVREETTKKKP